MGPRIFVALAAIAIGTATIGPARAQVGYTTTTIEGMVAGADVVVRARVAKVVGGPVEDRRRWQSVTLRVEETIRGPARDAILFARQVLASDRIFEAWRESGREHLWFLVRADGPEGPVVAGKPDLAAGHLLELARVVRLGPPVPAEADFGPPGQGPWTLPIFDHDLTLLAEPGGILRASRTAAAGWRGRKPAEFHPIDMPRAVMARTGRSGDANRLDVPVGPNLEALARRMIASPGDFIAPSDFGTPKDEAGRGHAETWLRFTRDLLRREGVKALGHFRSEANIAMIRPLLSDPAHRVLNKTENGHTVLKDGLPIPIGREYYVRKEAYETLHAWGVGVARPVIRELDRRDGALDGGHG
jgi:hypothetical protein